MRLKRIAGAAFGAALALATADRPALAAVAFDAKGAAGCDFSAATGSCTTLTIGSGLTNSALVVYVSYNSTTALTTSSVTWGGTTVPLVGSSTFSSAQHTGTAIYCLANPSSGNKTLSATLNGLTSPEIHFIGASYSGANQSTPCTNYASSVDKCSPGGCATDSITVTSASGDIATAAHTQTQQFDNATNGTTIVLDDAGPNTDLVVNYIAGSAPNVALTATSNGTTSVWQISGVDIAAAGAGVACRPTRLTLGAGC
jgi:hypothetical protein